MGAEEEYRGVAVEDLLRAIAVMNVEIDDGDAFGVDLVPGVYHTLVVLEPDTVIYEVKDGPYVASNDKAFAPWAPPEGSPEAPAYMARLLEAHNNR